MHRPADRPLTWTRAAAVLAGAALTITMAWGDARPGVGRSPGESAASAVRWGEERRFLVHFENVVRNEGPKPLHGVRSDLLLPVSNARQTVRWVRLSPHDWRIRTDVHGERVATASLEALAPGDATTFSWIASVELAEERHAPDVDATRASAPQDVRRYLADGPLFQLTSKAVRAAADEVRRAARDESPLSIARAAAAYVRRRITYAREGGWDPAATVLARGSGSCTESTYAFLAICRRLGVPARWIGGTMQRGRSSGRGLDTTFHRMAEAWISGHGWLPVEPSHGRVGDRDGERIPGAMLELAVGDGSGDAGAGPSYFARNRWEADAKGNASPAGRATCRAIWLPGIDDVDAAGDATGDAGVGEPIGASLAAILACDARGFGPPLEGSGRRVPLRDAPGLRRPIDVARSLLAAGEPEGVHLLAEVARTDPDEARDLLESGCDEALAAEVAPLLARDASSFENWWTRNLDLLLPRDRGPLHLTVTTPP